MASAEPIRPLVADSWLRSASVDPDRPPEIEVAARDVEDVRREAGLADAVPMLERLVVDDARENGLVAAMTDATGLLLWVDGDRSARAAAEGMGFVEGAAWGEDRVGTSAPGTALRLDRGVQISGAEHYATAVKPWSCTAVPVHEPGSGRLLGAIDITGDRRAVGAHTLPMLRAVAAAVEGRLALGEGSRRGRAGRASRPMLRILGTDDATLEDGVRTVTLGRRHSEILAVLVATPRGLGAADLAEAVYGRADAVVTLRAEIVRLHRVLAAWPGVVLASRPYRLSGVTSDVEAALAHLDRGARNAALGAYAGPVLPGSAAPGIDALRLEVRGRFSASFAEDASVDALLAWTATPDGAEDVAALRALLRLLPPRSPRRARIVAVLEALGG